MQFTEKIKQQGTDFFFTKSTLLQQTLNPPNLSLSLSALFSALARVTVQAFLLAAPVLLRVVDFFCRLFTDTQTFTKQ